MKRIIIPTDFSANAYNALAYALHLFADEKCLFYLLHAYSPPMPEATNIMTSANTAKKLIELTQESTQKGLDEVLQKIETSFKNPNHSFETIPAFGFLTDVINEIAKEKNADLIIMGTKGASGLKEIILGSNTSRVIGNARLPLIVVPENAVYEHLNEIAFFTDYESYFKAGEINFLLELARQSKAALHVVHVLKKGELLGPEKQKIQEDLTKKCEPIKAEFHLLTENDIENAIRLFVQSRNTPFLCLVTKKYTFLQNLFKTPTTKEVSFHTKTPMLVLKKAH